MKTIIVKSTFLQPEAAKFSALLKGGKSVLTPVFFREVPGNRIEATIDGVAIGNAEAGFEIPALYEAKLEGLGPDEGTFLVEIDADEKPKGGGIGYYAKEKALINFDIVPEDEVDLMIKFMEDNRVHPALISHQLTEKVANASPDRAPIPKVLYRDGNPGREYSYLNDVLISAQLGQACLLIGEKSVGKGVLTTCLAWLNCHGMVQLAMSAGMDSDSVFGGRTTDNSAAELLNEDLASAYIRIRSTAPEVLLNELVSETGSVEEASAAMAELKAKAARYDLLGKLSATMRIVKNRSAIEEIARNGGICFFDEMNMAEANFLQSLVHPMADKTHCLVLPDGTKIKLHKDFILVGAMNPTGYAGTRELNEATDSRFAHFIIEMPEDIEGLLRANFAEDTKLSRRHFKAAAEVYKDLAAAVDQGRLSSRCLNIRGFVRALEDVEAFPEATRLNWRLGIQVRDGCDQGERLLIDSMIRDKITF